MRSLFRGVRQPFSLGTVLLRPNTATAYLLQQMNAVDGEYNYMALELIDVLRAGGIAESLVLMQACNCVGCCSARGQDMKYQ